MSYFCSAGAREKQDNSVCLTCVSISGKSKIRSKSVKGGNLPSARRVSNAVHSTPTPKGDNTHDISIALFYFLQFIDHDLAKTPEGKKTCVHAKYLKWTYPCFDLNKTIHHLRGKFQNEYLLNSEQCRPV
jgi:hypothetical protein